MNLSPTPRKLSVMDLISELYEIQGITFIVFEPIKFIVKKKSWTFMFFQPYAMHALSKRVGVKAFFEENENEII